METQTQLVDDEMLLQQVFPEGARPSLRWLRYMRARRLIPYYKLGHLVRYDVAKVRAALDRLHVDVRKAA